MIATNTFTSGINRDLDKSILKSSNYYNAENFRLITNGGLSSGALENVVGNKFSVEVPDISNMYIGMVYPRGKDNGELYDIGIMSNGVSHIAVYNTSLDFYDWFISVFCNVISSNYISGLVCEEIGDEVVIYSTTYDVALSVVFHGGTTDVVSVYFDIIPEQEGLIIIGKDVMRDSIILYTTNCRSSLDSTIQSTGYGQIWELTYSNTVNFNTPTLTLKYNNLLGFSTKHLIKSYSRYETPDIRKIYWCDEYNILRFANISDPLLMSKDPGLLDIVSDIDFSEPILQVVSSTGNYLAGKVQYAYQLYNKNGQLTKFSNCTGLIHLTEKSDMLSETGTSPYYSGSKLNANTGKSVSIQINDIDLRFYGIKVVALFYTTINTDPTITYVYDGEIPDTGTLNITDNGFDSFGTLTTAEYTTMNSTFIVPKTITSKYDYLFVGNIKEKQFDVDFDARAYRFRGNSTTTYVTPDYLELTDWGINETADAINPSQETYPNGYCYQKSSAILGGTGPNVSYQFKLVDILADSNTNDRGITVLKTTNANKIINGYTYQNPSYDNYASPYLDSWYLGYQRGETYRFGIVFYDEKGLQSFVHWIGDIKMPEIYDIDGQVTYSDNGTPMYDFATCIYDSSLGQTKFLILYPEFTIDLSNLSVHDKDRIKSFSIVRVKRESQDRTIYAQGLLQPAIVNAGSGNNEPSSGWEKSSDYFTDPVRHKTLTTLFSPEVNFYPEYFNKESSDYVQIVGLYNYNTTIYDNIGTNEDVFKYRSFAANVTAINKTNLTRTVDDADIVGVSKTYQNVIDGVGFVNYIDNPSYNAYGGTRLMMNISSQFNNCGYLQTVDDFFIANYRRTKTQYGGNTHQARLNSQYINTGNNTNVTGSNLYVHTCFGGDTYITYFDYLQVSFDDSENPNTKQTISYIPVESSINCELRYDTCYSRGGHTYMLQETKAMGDNMFGSGVYYSFLTDLYQYNSVYSQQSDLVKFFPKPIDFKLEQHYDTMVRVSSKKYNGEGYDSWTIFNANDFKYVDSEHGAINEMLKYKDYILFWQDHAFGVQSVLPKSTVTDGNLSALRIGTGDVLDRHDYYSTNFGCKHKFGVIESRDSIAWLDVSLEKIVKFSGTDSPLSDIKGMQSFLSANIYGGIKSYDNILDYSAGYIGVYDDRFNEFLFSFYDYHNRKGTSHTLVYSDPIDAFTGFYTFEPFWYIRTKDKLLSVPKDEPNKIYIHNIGTYGEFYDTIYDSKIEFIVNDNYKYQKVYDSFQFITEVTLSGVDLLKETINKLRALTNYQNSDWYDIHYYDGTAITSSQIDATRRETSWSITAPRNAVLLNLPTNPDIFNPLNLDQTRPFRERLRDNSLFVSMIYQNGLNGTQTAKNYRFVMPYVDTTYRLSER